VVDILVAAVVAVAAAAAVAVEVVVECIECDRVVHADPWKALKTMRIRNWICQRARNPL
jgi:ribosomal protein S26